MDDCVNNILRGAVMSEVNYLGSRGLDEAPHDIDCSVVPIEQRGRGHDSTGHAGTTAGHTSRGLNTAIGSAHHVQRSPTQQISNSEGCPKDSGQEAEDSSG